MNKELNNQEFVYKFENLDLYRSLVGPMNVNLKMLMLEIDDVINEISINGEMVFVTVNKRNDSLLKKFLTIYEELYEQKINLEMRDLVYLINVLKYNKVDLKTVLDFYLRKEPILNTSTGRKIYPKSLTQYQMLKVIEENDVIFVSGSAGTGKTYLAMAYAVSELKKNKIKKIVITRPAVEAGEKLGFLPGDLKEKVDPYLVPIYDALDDFLGKEQVAKLVEKGIVEIAPLAYMRGRTLDNAFIILDEAQNSTTSQMRMFLTRLGFNSKMIITGDVTQIDLPHFARSGLVEAISLLKGIKGLEFVTFNKYDVMRHPIVTKIIEKYDIGDNNVKD